MTKRIKILLPVDGSPCSQRAVDYFLGNRHIFGENSTVLLLNVQWRVATGNVKLFINQDTINDYYRERGLAELQAARMALDEAQIPYQYHISVGSPAEAIAQYAREQKVDQIVMCGKRQSGLQAFLLGSVVARVLDLADCPVLLVK